MIIDTFSKFEWISLDKTGKSVAGAFESLFKLGRIPKIYAHWQRERIFIKEMTAVLDKYKVEIRRKISHCGNDGTEGLKESFENIFPPPIQCIIATCLKNYSRVQKV